MFPRDILAGLRGDFARMLDNCMDERQQKYLGMVLSNIDDLSDHPENKQYAFNALIAMAYGRLLKDGWKGID